MIDIGLLCAAEAAKKVVRLGLKIVRLCAAEITGCPNICVGLRNIFYFAETNNVLPDSL